MSPPSPDQVRVVVISLTTPATPGRVLALAWVRITSPELTFSCGPWRILERHGTEPAVMPPDVREDGRWVDTVKLPRPTRDLVDDAVLAEFRGRGEPT